MTDWSADFVSQDRQQLIPRTMGEALAKMVRARWPHSTAKHVARAWELDPTTAGNLIKGHASERTLTKAVRAEGWELLLALGHALTGQTHHEWEEARLQRIIQEAEHAQSRITQLRTRRALLAESIEGGDEAQPRQAPDHQGPTRTRQGGRRA